MSRLAHALAFVLVFTLSPRAEAVQPPLGTYFVAVDPALASRQPNGPTVGDVEYGDEVDVRQIRDGWARLGSPGFTARWVELDGLTRLRPEPRENVVQMVTIPGPLRDPRLAATSLPTESSGSLSQQDVLLIWRGANYLLASGRCSDVVEGAPYRDKADVFLFNCGSGSFVVLTSANIATYAP